MEVDPANEQQARAWDGDEGAHWAAHAEHYERALEAYHGGFLAAAAVGPADRVLDLGCGNGRTTRDAATSAPDGSALGIDLSGRMIERARSIAAAEGVANVEFVQGDAQIHPFPPESFDVAISRTSAMFFGDPVAALRNAGHALRRGGRLVLMTWQGVAGNEWLSAFRTALAAGRDLPLPPPDAPGPFALSEPGRVREVLAAAGFADVELEAVSAPMWFGKDAAGAYAFLLGQLGWMLDGLDDAARARALDTFRADLAAHETPDGVTYRSAAWFTTARRR